MKVTLLGTGTSQGVPVVGCQCAVCHSDDTRDHRLRTAAFIEVDGVNILLDAGPDLRMQLLRENITHVDAVLITHEHKDHLAGLDDIRPIYFMMKEPMQIYAMPRVLKVIRKDFDYAFKQNPYPGAPAFTLHPVYDDPFQVKGIEITPIHVRHLTLPILGYRIQDMAYITDGSFISETELQKLKGLKLLVINALRIKEHYSHFNLQQALAIIERLQPEQATITHISHEMGLYAETSQLLPKNVQLGYDGLSFEITKNE
ncbi:MAG: MBL fold metallo-hydrolase [Bacteroidales bacterium]|nr:MBL fold metallo-hydrolase [Bacteroidales bacterium]